MEQKDFVRQVYELANVVNDRSYVTSKDWHDAVSERFNANFTEKYECFINYFLVGSKNNDDFSASPSSLGFIDLQNFLSDKQKEIEELLSGIRQNGQAETTDAEGYFNRSDWGNHHSTSEPNPSQLDSFDISYIMFKKKHSDK